MLRDAAFRRFWSAQTVSYLGDQVTIVAVPLVAVLALDASPAEMGLLSAAGTVPNLLFALHAGALVDRRGRRRATMIATDVVRAALLASVPIAFWLGALTLAQLYAVAFLAGSLAVVFGVAANGLIPSLVPRDGLVRANSLLRGSYSFSWVVGPSVGGVLVGALSGPAALTIDAASFAASAVLLGTIRTPDPPGVGRERGGIREGLRFVRRTPVLLAELAAGGALNFFYSIYFTLIFLFAARELHLSPALIGTVLGAGAVGALAGAAVAGHASRRLGIGRAFVAGSLLYPAALVLVPLATDTRSVAVALLVAAELGSGFGLMLSDVAGSSIRQALTPDRLRSRVHGAQLAVFAGVRPLAALAAGSLGTWIGLRPALWFAALGGVASVLWLLRSPLARMRELPA